MDRDERKSILTFSEANENGVLDSILDDTLRNFYHTLKRSRNKTFYDKDGKIKPFEQIKNDLADIYFKDVIEAIYDDYMRNETHKYAEKMNLPAFNHVLIPRYKGFITTITHMRPYIDAVYDYTIGFPGTSDITMLPSIWEMIKGGHNH